MCVNCTVWDHRSDHSCVGYASLSGSLGSSAPSERLQHCPCQTRQRVMRALLAVWTLKHSPFMHHFLSFTSLRSPDAPFFFFFFTFPTLSMSGCLCVYWQASRGQRHCVCVCWEAAPPNMWCITSAVALSPTNGAVVEPCEESPAGVLFESSLSQREAVGSVWSTAADVGRTLSV